MRTTLVWAVLAGSLGLPAARADAIGALDFKAGSQSVWGPGRSSASLDEGGDVSVPIFGVDVGAGFNVDASTGTISGNYRGDLRLVGGATHDLASGLYALDSSFDATSGTLSTRFGASIDVYAFAGSFQLSFPGFPKGNNLNTSGNVNVELGSNKSFSGSSPFDLDALDVGVASVGATLRVTQGSNFRPTSIAGTLRAVHGATGTTLSRSYTIGDAIGLDLGLAGDWALSLDDLRLNNVYNTGFDGAIGGFATFLGGRAELTTKNFDLFDSRSFALSFGRLDWSNAYTVTVVDSTPSGPAPVPEPGTWALFGIAGAFVAVRRLRRQRASNASS